MTFLGLGLGLGLGPVRATASPAPTAAFIGNGNVSIVDQGGGVWRVTKTGGVDGQQDAWANSAEPIAGDCAMGVTTSIEFEAIGGIGLGEAPTAGPFQPINEGFNSIYSDGGGGFEAQASNETQTNFGFTPPNWAIVARIGNSIVFGGAASGWENPPPFTSGDSEMVPGGGLSPLYGFLIIRTLGAWYDIKFSA